MHYITHEPKNNKKNLNDSWLVVLVMMSEIMVLMFQRYLGLKVLALAEIW